MKKKNIFYILGFIIIIIILLSLGKNSGLTFWEDTQIACLPNGHQNLALHVHPTLMISVDGEQELIPANVGVTRNCMAELHTHDSTGTIHVESFDLKRAANFRLNNFFEVWGKDFYREGYESEILLNGEVFEGGTEDLSFNDLDTIEIKYTSINLEDGNVVEEITEEVSEIIEDLEISGEVN